MMDKQNDKNLEFPMYQKLKEDLKEGDLLMVTSLDRLGQCKEEVEQEELWLMEHGIMVIETDKDIK